jgi:regulator of protease activity HflC (stomatin/prohibitin superfamily)
MNNIMNKSFSHFRAWVRKHTLRFILICFFILTTAIVLWPKIHVIIPVGNVGILFRPIWGGTDLYTVLAEGIRLKMPWDNVTQYDTTIQQKSITVDVLTEDLLKSKLTVSYQFKVYEENIPMLHKYVGSNYVSKFVEPSIIASVRDSIGKLSSTDAFTLDIAAVQSAIRKGSDLSIINSISPPGINDVRLVRIVGIEFQDFSFPKEVEDAISKKMVESAKAASYPYILDAERSEATRKAIEAEGIRKFQDIIRPGLSDNYLRWRGIEATQKLAESSNSKMILFGQGPTGLPLIMGDMDKTPITSNKTGK